MASWIVGERPRCFRISMRCFLPWAHLRHQCNRCSRSLLHGTCHHLLQLALRAGRLLHRLVVVLTVASFSRSRTHLSDQCSRCCSRSLLRGTCHSLLQLALRAGRLLHRLVVVPVASLSRSRTHLSDQCSCCSRSLPCGTANRVPRRLHQDREMWSWWPRLVGRV